MTRLDKYPDGTYMDQFIHLKEISSYNHNYYIGFGKDLLFGKSNDDTITEWFLVNGDNSIFLGESHIENENLHRFDKRNT